MATAASQPTTTSTAHVHSHMLRAIWAIGKGRHLQQKVSNDDLYVPPAGGVELREKVSDVDNDSGVEMLGFRMPPAMFCPPGAGADLLDEPSD